MKRSLTLVPVLTLALFSLPKVMGMMSAILMIAGLIFFHEMGHFLAAKWMGMPVEVFSLGFGTRLVGFKWRETDIRLSVLPLGGYVKLAGYNPEEPDAEDPHGFLQQPFRKRMLFYSGGILANVATAFVIFTCLSVDGARVTAMHAQPSALAVEAVIPDAAAAKAGLLPGDLITTIGELHFPGNSQDEFRPYVEKRAGQPLEMVIEREGRTRNLVIIPMNEGGVGKLGIQFLPSKITYDMRPFELMDLLRAPKSGAFLTADLSWQVLRGLGMLVTTRNSYKQLGGPATIVKTASHAAQNGLSSFFGFMAFISINLAVLNALPIPFLDGGHMAILCFEKLRRKDLSIQFKEKILTAGFFFLATLMALVIGLDIWKMRH